MTSTRGIPFLSASGLHTGVSVYPLKGEWGLAITCSRQIPYPASPPYFVRTLHMGSPGETKKVLKDSKSTPE